MYLRSPSGRAVGKVTQTLVASHGSPTTYTIDINYIIEGDLILLCFPRLTQERLSNRIQRLSSQLPITSTTLSACQTKSIQSIQLKREATQTSASHFGAATTLRLNYKSASKMNSMIDSVGTPEDAVDNGCIGDSWLENNHFGRIVTSHRAN
ncbi:hypothetical protein CCUS01_14221 [Colletotrichum cuscutae]|uniref:Uncharacterized protein n=1 Tax=Colletotrichum cuscutae TaxID=1209917 RepID=A0AAI9Y9V8_9PEZI|nr:hypothetical protein CCUS01_14221 [Colletotrichum cuscutae]